MGQGHFAPRGPSGVPVFIAYLGCPEHSKNYGMPFEGIRSKKAGPPLPQSLGLYSPIDLRVKNFFELFRVLVRIKFKLRWN